MSTPQGSSEVKKRLVPTSNEIRIASNKQPRVYMFLVKLFLLHFAQEKEEKNRCVQLHALGESSKIAVRVAENLER